MKEELIKLYIELGIKEKIDIKQTLEALSTLEAAEEEIMKMRLGLYEDKVLTRVEIAKRNNITIDVVRNTEARARRKLRHPLRRRIFMGMVTVDELDESFKPKETISGGKTL